MRLILQRARTSSGRRTKKRKLKRRKKEIEAIVHIYTSFNNTIVHVTDMSGRTLSKVTGGMVTKHSRLESKSNNCNVYCKKSFRRNYASRNKIAYILE